MKGAGAEPAILFVEVPDLYAEVERRNAPSLLGLPVLVGGDPRKSGRVQSLSQEARDAGVVHGMAMAMALEACPNAVRVPTEMRRYREASGDLVACLRGFFGEVESAGLGAAYADVRRELAASDEGVGALLARAGTELRLPLRAGIAPSKFLARLAAEEADRGTVYRLRGAQTAGFLASLPVERLPRVGTKTAVRLRELGAQTVGEVSRLDAGLLEEALGNHGLTILEMARGQDRSPVRVARTPQSIGREKTFDEPSADVAVLTAHLEELAVFLSAGRARRGGGGGGAGGGGGPATLRSRGRDDDTLDYPGGKHFQRRGDPPDRPRSVAARERLAGPPQGRRNDPRGPSAQPRRRSSTRPLRPVGASCALKKTGVCADGGRVLPGSESEVRPADEAWTMTPPQGRERRRFQRIPMDQVVSFAELGQSEQLGRAVDLSKGGIRFRVLACEIGLGDRLNLTFIVLGQSVSVIGVVSWATEIDPLTLEVGLEFEEIDMRSQALLDAFAEADTASSGAAIGALGAG